ncbi:hypothetical protein LTR04_006759 [Oleoguttula sp. CCFEE 6159]|nr:hypothetical protein LTR04_006759 [Oleoguttula sp. CCFEE 6159]
MPFGARRKRDTREYSNDEAYSFSPPTSEKRAEVMKRSSGIVHLMNVLIGFGPLFWDDDTDTFLPQWGQPGHLGEGLARYPTDFTRDVLPIPCHSHNDYWRRVPLFEALHYGCTGVEADVWMFDRNDELFVGHDKSSLSPNRTFQNLYVHPLVEILDKQNPSTEFVDTNAMKNGVFDEEPERTLVLLVDFKTSGRELFPHVQDQLSVLRSKGYLTYFNGSATVVGPVTVVGTGNTPFDLITGNDTYRDVFFDAPLESLWVHPAQQAPATAPKRESLDDGLAPKRSSMPLHSLNPKTLHTKRSDAGQGSSGLFTATSSSAFDSSNSYYASVSFMSTIGYPWRGRLSAKQMLRLRGQIAGAKSRGLKARYWDTPNWPIGLRNHVWDILVKEGVDYLNVDDLKAAAKKDWKTHKHPFW